MQATPCAKLFGGTAAPAAPAATKTYVDTLTHNYNEAKRELDERKAECRNDLRALTLCCVVAVCGASAFMQLAVILWPVAVVMIWGALEVGWEVFGAYRNHCAARAAAQGRANEALKLLREEQGRCTQDLRAQNRLQATQTAHLMLQQPAVAARPNH